MDAIYLVSLLVGGFFVLLSLFGGGDHETDVDTDAGGGVDLDSDADFDVQTEVDIEGDTGETFHVEHTGVSGAGHGLVDLFSIRALFLFAAFFGLTGTLLSLVDTGEPYTAIVAVLTGLVIGLGGNYLIKRVGYEHVSSAVTAEDLRGRTGTVLIPFGGLEKGKIRLDARGQRLQLRARPFGDEFGESFSPGDEVVVVRVDKGIAEVVKAG